MKLTVTFIGPAGSYKSTFARKLAKLATETHNVKLYDENVLVEKTENKNNKHEMEIFCLQSEA